MTRLAVVGASGCVGREMLSVLEADPLSETPPTLFGSESSRGAGLPYRGEQLPIQALAEPLAQFDIVLFAASSEVARVWAPRFAAAGATVIDNSSAFRRCPDVPLVVPELNGDQIGSGAGIIANPNCSTILLVLALAPLVKLGRFEVVVSTYQAVSGAGRLGLEALERERAHRGFEPNRPFPFPIEGNLFPLVGPIVSSTGETGEEEKLRLESQRILGLSDLELHATCVRVPVERCHSESVTLRFDAPVELPDVCDALRGAPGVRFWEDPRLPPTPAECARDRQVSVGRVRASSSRVIQLWLVGDQLLKAAALNAVQIAALAVQSSRVGNTNLD